VITLKPIQKGLWELSKLVYALIVELCCMLSLLSESVLLVLSCSGYMPPEYAVYGYFSVKSDVFSFGVIVLEIVSGRKNTRFLDPLNQLNLIGHVSMKCEYNPFVTILTRP